MNTPSYFNQNLLAFFYIKYKAFVLPSSIILACICAFLFGIIPQLQIYFSNQDTVKSDQETISVIQENINTLALLKEADVNENLALTSTALPIEKDFTGILNAISSAASIANVGLGDYTFEVGDILGKNSAIQNGQLTIQITLSIIGDLASVQRFIDTLDKEFPLSEVTSIHNHGSTGADITAIFFYKPLSNVNPIATAPLPKLSIPQQKLLTGLKNNFDRPNDISLPKKQIPTVTQVPSQ